MVTSQFVKVLTLPASDPVARPFLKCMERLCPEDLAPTTDADVEETSRLLSTSGLQCNARVKLLALGRYPDVPLATPGCAKEPKGARELRDDARSKLAAGIDSAVKRKAEKLATADTFKAVAQEFLVQREKGWAPTHASKVKARLEWLCPFIGDRPIGAIEAPELLRPVRTIEECGKGETAKRTLLNAGQVFRFAVATGRAKRDPKADLRGALAPVRGSHHPAIIEPKAFGALPRAIDGYPGEPVTRAALALSGDDAPNLSVGTELLADIRRDRRPLVSHASLAQGRDPGRAQGPAAGGRPC